MKKTIDFSQEVINEVMALAWDLKVYDFAPVAKMLLLKGLEHKEDFLKEKI